MMNAAWTLLALLAVCATAHKISRIVVLMEENRSYDHLQGWYNKSKHGLTRADCNLVNTTDPKSKKVCATKHAPYVNYCDPDHSFVSTTYKIFGPTKDHAHNLTNPTMEGFVEFERDVLHVKNPKLQYCGVMDAFTPERLPVLTALADDFVMFDKMYCSLPGPTWPNRLFFLSGTSAGLTETIPWYHLKVGELFPQKTIFDQVEEAGGTWKYYYDDTPWELFLESLAHRPEKTFGMEQFFADARDGTLPHFSFINPRAGVNLTVGLGSNDMHPDHDVALGELLYKDIYEALRAGPMWNETLFILTFDEHGGFYDHVPPPQPIPSPDDGEKSYPDKFKFDRQGIRIPTLMASPWLPKGKILSDPPSDQQPTPTSNYELTSIMATVRKLLPFMNNTKPLTKRDAWAATFEHLFDELSEPRTDCPMKLPAAPPPSLDKFQEEQRQPINGLQTAIMGTHAHLAGVDFPKSVTEQRHVSPWLRAQFQKHREQTLAWQASKASVPYEVRLQPGSDAYEARVWYLAKNASKGFETLSVKLGGKRYCLDGGDMQRHSALKLSLCYPDYHPSNNRDKSQQWHYRADHTLRPAGNASLCVGNRIFSGTQRLHLETCDKGVSQSYAYMWGPPGPDGGDVVFQFGDAYYELRVVKK